MPPIYPFTAVVSQERMKRALVLNAVAPLIGGVLIRGERGTAKDDDIYFPVPEDVYNVYTSVKTVYSDWDDPEIKQLWSL